MVKINNIGSSILSPSYIMCIDETTPFWYGKEEHWINLGLLMHVSIARKPENGKDI